MCGIAGEISFGGDPARRDVEPGWLTPSDAGTPLLEEWLSAPEAETSLDAVLRLDTHLLMIDDPVKRVDNTTMVAGLEARVPFLAPTARGGVILVMGGLSR